MGKVNEALYIRKKSDVDNRLNGCKLESLKRKFLSQFEYKMNMLESVEPGYKKKAIVYNYIMVMKSYIKDKDIKSASRILIFMCKNDIFYTVKLVLGNFREYIKRNIIYK